ncbi:MAG: pitrilysin family protein [Candidatus Paceibacterota bacterium]
MTYNKTVLSNGLRVITIPMKDNPTVTVFVLVEAGSKYETKDKNGISHFLEHMCFKGTVNRPNNFDISTELDTIGAIYNAFTSQEYTGYYAKAEYNQLPKLLDVISDMYLNPLFDEREIEKEKGVIIEEINMREDLPQYKVQNLITELVYGDQPAGWDIAGPKDNIKKINREDFIKYRNQFYVSSATTVIVSGNFDEVKTLSEVEKIFSAMPKSEKGIKIPVQEKQTKPEVALFKKDTDQAHLVLGVRTFNTYDERNKIMDVLIGILDAGMSSRLFKKLRDEMGVCYYVSASQDALTDHGLFSVSAGVNNERVAEVVSVILSELNKLKTELVSAEELNKVKQNLIGTMYLGLESSNSLAKFYGFQEIMNEKIKTPEEIKKEVESVTAEQVQDLAKEIFVDRGLNLAIVGRFEDKKPLADILKF